MVSWLESSRHATGDPGRVHTEGRIVRAIVEQAREQVAALLGTRPRQVVFTSGGTEAVNAATWGATRARPGQPIVLADVEHSSVRDASVRAGCRRARRGRPPRTHRPRRRSRTPSEDTARSRRSRCARALPGRQSRGRHRATRGRGHRGVPAPRRLRPRRRLHGRRAHRAGSRRARRRSGVGERPQAGRASRAPAPWCVRRGLRVEPWLLGGEQERARRGGLENVAGIVGFGAAAEALTEPGRLARESAAARAGTPKPSWPRPRRSTTSRSSATP